MNLTERYQNLIGNEIFQRTLNRDEQYIRNRFVKFKQYEDEIGDKFRNKTIEAQFIESLSPFKTKFKAKSTPDLLGNIKIFYEEIKCNQYSLNDRKKLLDAGLEGLMKSVKIHAKEMLPDGIFFEDDFMEKRLEYLLNTGKEPIELTDEDLEFLFTQIKLLLKNVIKQFLSIDVMYEIEDEMAVNDSLFIKYLSNCLTRYKTICARYMIKLGDYYARSLDELNEADMIFYRRMQVCPLSYGLDDNKLSKFKIDRLSVLSKNIEALYRIVGKDEFMKIINGYLLISEKVLSEYEQGKTLGNFTEPHYRNGLLTILDTIPKIKQYII